MHEYIKKLSFSLCLIKQIIKDIKFKENIKELEMSLIRVAADFFVSDTGNSVSIEKSLELRKILVQVVDLLDLAKVGKVISTMNAEIIISASLRLIEEVDVQIHRLNSFALPRFSLSEMSEKLLRDRVREDEQSKFLNSKFEKDGGEVFNSTKIPELKLSEPQMSEPGLHRLNDLQISVIQNNGEETKIADSKKVAEKNTVLKFDWGNGHVKEAGQQSTANNQEPMVYTFFGSEDKIIEDRKNKLLDILKVGGGVAIGEVTKHFPGLNVKTLQRDLLDLMREKKVIMLGKKRWAKYYLK